MSKMSSTPETFDTFLQIHSTNDAFFVSFLYYPKVTLSAIDMYCLE